MPFLDIRRVRETPFRKLERPRPSAKWQLANKIARELSARTQLWLFLVAAFLIPALVWDFGGSQGSVRSFGALVLLGLILFLAAVSVIWLQEPFLIQRPALTVIGGILVLLVLVLSWFGADPKTSFNLSALPASPGAWLLVFGWLIFILFANRPLAAGYLKRVLTCYLLGSGALGAYVLVRFFLGGYNGLSWVADGGWLTISAVTVLILTGLAFLEPGWLKIAWFVNLALHLAWLFLWDQTIPWLIIIAGAVLFLFVQRRILSARISSISFYYLQVAGLAAILLFLPIKVFTGNNPPTAASYSWSEVQKVISGLSWRSRIWGAGAGNGALVLGNSGVSFFDPDPQAAMDLFFAGSRVESQAEGANPDWPGSGAFPLEKRLNNGYAHLFLEIGLIGFLFWILLNIGWLALCFRYWTRVLKPGLTIEPIIIPAVPIFLAALAFTPWTVLTWIFWLFLLILTVAACPPGLKPPPNPLLGTGGGTVQRTPPPSFTKEGVGGRYLPWLRRLGALGALVLFLFVAISSGRVVYGSSLALQASRTSAPGLAYNFWEKASQLNPGNEWYGLKLEESRINALNEAPSLPEQKEIIANASRTFAKISRSSLNPLSHWLTARLYASLEPWVEGTAPLARQSYLKAIELWGANVVLPTELAWLYRTRTEGLVSTEVSASALQDEAEKELRRVLKSAPDYLPARLELAFIIEKQKGIPSALSELESWEAASPEIRYHLGRLYFNDNQLPAAQEKFKQVIAEVPEHSNARYSLAVIYFRQGQYRESLAEFEKVDELNPGNEDVKAKIEEVRKKIK